jgi:hypothetical protein
MRRSIRLASFVLLLAPLAAMAENSIFQPIADIELDATNEAFWLTGAARWSAPSCPNATYGRILPTLQGYKQLLALTLAAHAAGKSVRLTGNCHTDPDYFNVTYITVR